MVLQLRWRAAQLSAHPVSVGVGRLHMLFQDGRLDHGSLSFSKLGSSLRAVDYSPEGSHSFCDVHDTPGPSMTVSPPLLANATPEFRAVLERHADRLDLELIDRALKYSSSAHRGQKRMSGEDFISHSIAVALILAEQLLDTTSIAAALLRDVVEDS